MEFLRGNSHYGSDRIDPSRGAHQAYIHQQYKKALRFSLAEDRAARDQTAQIDAGEPPLSEADMEVRVNYYLFHLPRRLHRMRYASFTVYFALLKRLGWVEATGEQRPSLPQDYDPNFQPRPYNRQTPQRMAAAVPEQLFDPIMVLYPHYTREQRSGKLRQYPKVPGLPRRPSRVPRAPAPEAPAPEGARLMTQAEADQAFARQAAEAEEAETVEAPAGPVQELITRLQDILDPEKKARSLTRLEKALDQAPPELLETIEGLDDLEAAVEAYRDAEGKEDKQAAWEDIESSLKELEVLEE